jgi:hypothetical protein
MALAGLIKIFRCSVYENTVSLALEHVVKLFLVLGCDVLLNRKHTHVSLLHVLDGKNYHKSKHSVNDHFELKIWLIIAFHTTKYNISLVPDIVEKGTKKQYWAVHK